MPRDKAQDARRQQRRLQELRDEVLAPLAAEVSYAPSVSLWPCCNDAAAAASSSLIDWDALPRECDPAHAIRGGGGGGGKIKSKAAAAAAANAAAAAAGDDNTNTPQPQPPPRAAARAHRKRLQAESFARPLLSLLGPPPGLPGATVVDFGCGSGNLILPLAAAWRACRWVGVDMKPAPLRLLRQRAADAGLTNVTAVDGMIESYQGPLDVALALHACGNATDRALQLAALKRAAFVVSPCCVGKLKFSMASGGRGTSFHAQLRRYTPQAPGDRPADRLPIAVAVQQQQQQQQQEELVATAQKGGGGSSSGSDDDDDGGGGDEKGGASAPAPDSPTAAAAPAHGLPPLEHPRSAWLRARLPNPERQFALLARVADAQQHAANGCEDAGGSGDANASAIDAAAPGSDPSPQQQQQEQQQLQPARLRAELAAAAKALVERDRAAAAAEAGYAAGLLRGLDADTALGRGDLIVGLPPLSGGGSGNSSGSGAVLDVYWREARKTLEALCGPIGGVVAG